MSLFRDLLIEKKRKPYYCEVEYLESTGTQYIDTGYKLVSGTTHTFNGNIMWTQSNGNANFFYGYRSVNSAEYRGDMRAFFVYGTSAPPAGRLAIRYGVNTDNSTSTISQNQKYNISFDGTNLKVDGTTFINLSEAYTPANYQNMWLFNCNTTGYYSADVAKFSGRIYNWQIFEDGVLVRDFIPVLGWDGKGYMYDKVSGQLFGNVGTGNFSYGREIHYVEYLESTGEQYIDTGYIPNTNTECSMNLAFVSLDSTYRTPFSVRTADGAANSFTIMSSRETNDNNSFAFGSNYWSGYSVPKVVLNKTVEAVLRKGYASWDGVSGSPGTSITPTTLTAYMFARNSNGTAGNFFMGKIYSCIIKDNNITVRDYIPAIDENGVGFMFDRVSHTCFLNAGQGQFKYPAREVEYLQSSGTQYIDTGWHPSSNNLQVKFKAKSMGSPSATAICGAEKNGITPRWVFILYGQSVDATKTYPLTGDWNNNNQGFTFTSGTILDIDWATSSTSTTITDAITNTTYTQTFGSSINYPNNTVTLKLFQNSDTQKSSIQMNYYQIWDNDTLVRDFIPVFQDGQAGMLDKTNNVFYSNTGTGTFTTGKIVESHWF